MLAEHSNCTTINCILPVWGLGPPGLVRVPGRLFRENWLKSVRLRAFRATLEDWRGLKEILGSETVKSFGQRNIKTPASLLRSVNEFCN
jgi:hypothetical protein